MDTAPQTEQPRTSNLLENSGTVLGSADPERLVAWYRRVLEPLGAEWQEHMLVVAGGSYIGFDRRDDVADAAAEPGRQLLNFTVSDIRATEAHLDALGVEWVRPVEWTDLGAYFSTVSDPDGNLVQFIHTPAELPGRPGHTASPRPGRTR